MKDFLKRKGIEISFKRYLIDAMSAMAMGLFSTLIIGVIFRTIGEQAQIPYLVDVLAKNAIAVGGVGIAVAVSISLQAPPLVIYASIVNGFIGSALGGPIGAFLATVVGVECGKLISKETPIDVVMTPAFTIITGSIVGTLMGGPIDNFMKAIGTFLVHATQLTPVPMGMLISLVMGVLLVMPTSSTAIAIMISLTGIASGASAVGCCAICVGFGVSSYRDNGLKGLLAQIPGSPMIQVGNIMRNPRILIPSSLACLVVGPLATTIFKITCLSSATGTGTSGFVTPIGMFAQMSQDGLGLGTILFRIGLLGFILPAFVSYFSSEFLRKIGWIKEGDMALEL